MAAPSATSAQQKGAAVAAPFASDYQGLAIARSLRRRGVTVVVVDDEHSISRYSRYVARSVKVSDLRDGQTAVELLLELGRRYALDGWVVFPTREETVAALSRQRERKELIPGSGRAQLAYCAFFKEGRAQAKMIVRRLRQHPADFGRASTYVQTIDHPDLDEPSERFLRSIGYYGWREYLRSVRAASAATVFSRDDPLPGLAEVALLPYLAIKRGF